MTTTSEFVGIIDRVLGDDKLSRTERQALRLVFAEITDPRKRSEFRRAAFTRFRESLGERGAQVDWLEDVVTMLEAPTAAVTPPSAAVWFSPKDDCGAKVAQLIAESRKSADICVFTITDDRIRKEILSAKRRGARIRIVSDDEKSLDRGSDIADLAAEGIPIRRDRTHHHMHHKFAILDEARLVTGSFNWTRSGSLNNNENMILLEDPRLVAEFQTEFNSLWKQWGQV